MKMKMNIKNLLLTLMFVTCSSLAGQYPVVTEASISLSTNFATMKFSQKVMDIGPASEQIIPHGGEIILGGPVYYMGKYTLGSVAFMEIHKGTTFGDAAMQLYTELHASQYTSHDFSINPNGIYCIGYGAGNLNEPFENATFPAGCTMAPPPNQWCKLTTPQLILDHGTITLGNAEGNTASDTIGVTCTAPMEVKFNLMTDDSYVYLDEGKSEITVNDMPLNSKISLEQGDSLLYIKDKLTGITSEGFHTGSSVLIMSPY